MAKIIRQGDGRYAIRTTGSDRIIHIETPQGIINVHLNLTDEVDFVIASSEIGFVKPNPEAFMHVLDVMGLDASEVLMVGDNAIDDGSAANLGIRSLVLPRTSGITHGLVLVLGVVAAAQTLRD